MKRNLAVYSHHPYFLIYDPQAKDFLTPYSQKRF